MMLLVAIYLSLTAQQMLLTGSCQHLASHAATAVIAMMQLLQQLPDPAACGRKQLIQADMQVSGKDATSYFSP